jgi:hypothetical protein
LGFLKNANFKLSHFWDGLRAKIACSIEKKINISAVDGTDIHKYSVPVRILSRNNEEIREKSGILTNEHKGRPCPFRRKHNN